MATQEEVSESTSGLTDEQIRQETGAPFILSGNRRLAAAALQEGQNRVLYLLLAIGDENVAHDHWHPDVADALLNARQEIIKRLKVPRPGGVMNTVWPQLKADGTRDWPDFEKYTWTSG